MLSGILLTEKQLMKKQVTDLIKGEIHLICPGMITRIEPAMIYNPVKRPGATVHYVNGDKFTIDITTQTLAQKLGITNIDE